MRGLADVVQDTEMPTISPEGCEEKCSDPVLVSVVKKHHGWITKVCHLLDVVWVMQAVYCQAYLLITSVARRADIMAHVSLCHSVFTI